jgi:hypothetical protein
MSNPQKPNAMKTLATIIIAIALFIASINVCIAGLDQYNPSVPKTLTFVVKVSNLDNHLPNNIINIFEVSDMEVIKNKKNYYLGRFTSFQKAELYKITLNQMGLENVEVIAYFRQQNISLEDALTLSQNQNTFEQDYVKIDNISVDELNELLNISSYAAKFYYALHVDASDVSQVMNELQTIGTVYLKSTNSNEQYFTVGNFKKYEQAKAERINLIELGYKNVYIAAYLENDRIALEKAKELETIYLNSYMVTQK